MNHLFSERAKNIKSSEIREILKLASRENIISFAGGLPAPELFPVEEMQFVSTKVLEEMGCEALQYSPTEGYDPLRKKITDRMAEIGIKSTKEDVLITSGSQQGLDFSGKIFLNQDDIVLCESPSYLGAINAFRSYGCQFKEVKTDDDGMVMSDLEEAINNTENIRLIYVIPDFQNPSGRTWSLDRRKKLVELANKYDLPIVEDNPYGELIFEGERLPAVKSFDSQGRVVFLGTFSKTFSPGLRIGWVCAGPAILDKYIMVKQSADLQSSSLAQRELNKFLDVFDMNEHIDKIKDVYKTRRDLMIQAMEKYFPKEVTFNVPKGGLFTWVEVPNHINTRQLLEKSLEQNVAFVPGESFFPNGGVTNTMRMNYSNMSEPKIVEGIRKLGEILYEEVEAKS